MATAQEPTGPSGKTGGFEANKECDLCGSTTPVKYCPECEFTLCPICSKGHGKIQSTKDHALLDIGLTRSSASYAKSGDVESGPSLCIKHPKSVLQLYCEQCILLICDECRPNHNDHTVQSIKDDLKMYQNICTHHIKNLLDRTHNLEEHKALISGVFTSYDTAIQMVRRWEDELIQLVQDSSKSLKEDLEIVRKEWEDVVNDEDKGLTKIAAEVENKLSTLYNIRKVNDVDIFSQELANSQQLLAKADNFIKNVLPKLTVPTVNEIMPNMSQLPSVKSGIIKLMTPGTRRNTATAISPTSLRKLTPGTYKKTTANLVLSGSKYTPLNLDSPCLQYQIDITDPDSKQGYRINKSFHNKQHIMIYGSRRKDIRFLNLDDNTLERHTSDGEFFNIVSITPDEYIAIGYEEEWYYLLNFKFKTLKTVMTARVIRGISYLCDRTFLLLEVEAMKSQYKAHISIIKIENGRFNKIKKTSLDVKEKMKRLTTDENQTHIFMSGDEHLYRVKLSDWSTQHLDVSEWPQAVWSLCVVGDHLLVGDGGGEVHLLDTQLRYNKVILNVDSPVQDISVTNGYLILSLRDNRILLYK